ncbi:MAG: NUDIX hydrolase [Parachlamydiaceae bacterium]|nr:NUDIX hydrolase [Parachlamydiaceae bacterium]
MRLVLGLTVYFMVTITSLPATIFIEPPAGFKPKVDVVGVFIEHDKQVLFLHRQDHISEGNTWCVPGGKVEKGEELVEAAIRETFEETRYVLSAESLEFVKTLYVKFSEKNQFLYHVFRAKLNDAPANVCINWKEHKGFTWVTPEDALKMSLITDEDFCLNLLYGTPMP